MTSRRLCRCTVNRTTLNTTYPLEVSLDYLCSFFVLTFQFIDREILEQLENERVVVFTPSRTVCGKLQACHDDRFILNLASRNNGIVVSNDNYRDLASESEDYPKVIKERLLMYVFVKDEFMPPDDPQGQKGPTLSAFLRFSPTGDAKYQQLCPYDKKCTYGIKCKYLHPERDPSASHKSLAEQI